MHKSVIAVLAGGLAVGIASCQSDPGPDRTGAAEEAIEARIQSELDRSSTATCDDPTATDPGTTFACTATADDGKTYHFVATIVDDHEISVALHP